MNLKEIESKYLQSDYKLKSEFAKLDHKRTDLLTRCERYAGWTLPNVFPDDPLMEYDEMQNDYQSVGAMAVTNLANKIMMALFQPTRPFFRLELTPNQRKTTIASGMEEAQLDEALATAERTAMKELTKRNARVVITDAIIQLIVTGNALLYTPDEGAMQMYSLRDYVITRDLRGDTVNLIIRETKEVNGLSDELAAIVMKEGYGEDDEVSLYTGIRRIEEGRYLIWQELEDVCYCHKAIGVSKEEDLEWIPLTWSLCRGKDNGTGLVENYAGDFHTLSTLAEASLDYTTVMTDIKNLVNPAGMTDVRELTQAPSGAYVSGREEDIFVHSPEVQGTADFLEKKFASVERRIGAAFLLNSSVTRDAERVTAVEIRMQAQELESSLGGVYSRLATELQLPLAKKFIGNLPEEVFKDIEPTIVTGLESLSRNSELDNIRAFVSDLVGLAEVPEEVSIRLDFENIISVLGAGHGVEYRKFMLPAEKVEQNRQDNIKRNAVAAGAEAGAVAQAEK